MRELLVLTGKRNIQKLHTESWHKNIPWKKRYENSALLKSRSDDHSGTEYTGLIKSTADLNYWANVTKSKHRCRRCNKGMDEAGLCLDCLELLVKEGRCQTCFDVVCNTSDTYNTSMDGIGTRTCCTVCTNKSKAMQASNTHGYKEGGVLGGGLRTNYWVDNENDDIAKICEG